MPSTPTGRVFPAPTLPHDFVKGIDERRMQGVALHVLIEAFTRGEPVFRIDEGVELPSYWGVDDLGEGYMRYTGRIEEP